MSANKFPTKGVGEWIKQLTTEKENNQLVNSPRLLD